jgi:hypothetical protein
MTVGDSEPINKLNDGLTNSSNQVHWLHSGGIEGKIIAR